MTEEWSDLPTELAGELLNRLKYSTIDILRFRSVCSAWRKAATSHLDPEWDGQNPKIHNSTLPIFPNDDIPLVFENFSLCRRSIFLLSHPDNVCSNIGSSWVIKIEEKASNSKTFHLFHPLSRTRIMPLPSSFPKVLNLSCIRIHELGHEYLFRCLHPNSRGDGEYNDDVYKDNVALLYQETHHFMLLTIHVSGKLVLFSSVRNEWHLINDFQSPFDDVLAFDGEFYAVDCMGRAFVVDIGVDFNLPVRVTTVAKPVCGGDRKRLAVLGDELVLVDMYIGLPPLFQDQSDDGLDDMFMQNRSMSFKVFRLDRVTHTWVELHSLGDYILFLGVDSSFSASTNHLSPHKPNCIYFPLPENACATRHDEEYEDEYDDGDCEYHRSGVFCLDDATFSFSQLFWPPPPWISSSSS